MDTAGLVFHIQRFSLHDGPGIRTTIFLKGCSMECFWCHNPEGRGHLPEVLYFPERCMACGECVAVCPTGAHELIDGVHTFVRERCLTSGECVIQCPSGALELAGRSMTVEEVMEEVRADTAFYESSGGGVTLSGGEPGLHSGFARALLERCRQEKIHTAFETCGYCTEEALSSMLPVTDLVMMDLKHIATDRHTLGTGRANDRILDNASFLALQGVPLVFRTPVVPSFNDTEEEIGEIAAFVRHLADSRRINTRDGVPAEQISYELIPFHRLGLQKYGSLGLKYDAASLEPPSREKMEELANAARRHGINPKVR